jgi:hypothetical protein
LAADYKALRYGFGSDCVSYFETPLLVRFAVAASETPSAIARAFGNGPPQFTLVHTRDGLVYRRRFLQRSRSRAAVDA